MKKTITPKDFKKLLDQCKDGNSVCIDVRTGPEFREGSIEGAVNLPLDAIGHKIDELKKFDHVLIVCASGNRSSRACQKLEHDIENLYELEGGITAWEEQGFTSEGGKGGKFPMIQQVMIVAGALIISGAVSGYMFSSYFYLISFGVGCGLLYAGVSGNCMMMKILAKMPWNKG